MTALLSIVIPTRNGEATLAPLLDDLTATRRTDVEILVVDNGSIDRTATIAADYSVTCLRWDAKVGPGPARNAGVRRATGKYVLFVDADCRIDPDSPLLFVEEFEQLRRFHPKLAAVSGQVLPQSHTFADELASWVEHWEYRGGPAEPRAKLSTSNCLVLKTAFDTVGGFDECLMVDEDRELGLRLTRQGYTVFYTPRIVVWHGHDRNSLWKIVTHQYRWGCLTGLVNEQKYQRERGLWFLPLIQRPLVYLSIVPGLCLALTLRIIRRNWRKQPQVVGYAPLIFLAKVAYRLGVVAWLWRFGETRETT